MKTGHQSQNRLSWLWLIIGVTLVSFASLQPSLPPAAWLAPVFFLRFMRMYRPHVGLLLVAVAQCLALGINWYIGTAPKAILAISGVSVGLMYTGGPAVDRLFAPRLRGLSRALVFPLAMTSVDWLGSQLSGALTSLHLASLFGVSAA
jgi:apolipoprotein N-acyltransferase